MALLTNAAANGIAPWRTQDWRIPIVEGGSGIAIAVVGIWRRTQTAGADRGGPSDAG